jgi:D-aminopeptidase
MRRSFKNILIISDIEGSSECRQIEASLFLTRAWRRACLGMTRDVAAVVSALFDAGVETVTVKDFHRTGYNLLPEFIDGRAAVVCGYRQGPVPGIGDPGGAEAVMFIGMHAAAGTQGFMAHTLTSRIKRLDVNGEPLPEIALFSASLAPFGLRPVFFSGCPEACSQAERTIPGIHRYPIDKAADPARFDADSWREGLARAAVESLGNTAAAPYRPEGPFRAEIVMRKGEEAARKIAGRWHFERRGRRIILRSPDMNTLYDSLLKLCFLSPLKEKTLRGCLFLYNLRGRLGRVWVRRGINRDGTLKQDIEPANMRERDKKAARAVAEPPGFHVRNYRPGDDRTINRFINETFDLKMPLETWRWKYLRNPTTRRTNITLGWMGNRLVSHFGCRHRYYKTGDRSVLTAHPTEVAVHKDFRKMDILLESKKGTVDRAKALGCAFGLGFPTKEHFKVGTKLLQYRHVTDMPVLSGPAGTAHHGGGEDRWGAGAGPDLRVRPFQRFDARADGLWDRLSKDYPVIGDRRSRYMNWRYAEHPGRAFTMHEITRGGRLEGFSVIAADESAAGDQTATIMEFFTVPEEAVQAPLFDASMAAVREAGVRRCRCACLPHTALYAFLTGRGMAPEDDPLKFVIEIYDETLDPDLMMNGRHWFLGYGDFDLFD